MRIPMVSALCIAFVSVSFPHPAAAQVNPGNPQSFQVQHPTTTQQSAPGHRANFADQQANRPCCNLLTAPLPNRHSSSVFEQAARPWFKWINGEQAAIDSILAASKEKGASHSQLSEQLAHAMMRLADKDNRPPWPLVSLFTDNLTRQLLGNQLTAAQNAALRDLLSEAMRPTGTSNARLATRLQEILVAAGLNPWKSQLIISDFIKLRESIQSPDDLPVRLTIPIPH